MCWFKAVSVKLYWQSENRKLTITATYHDIRQGGVSWSVQSKVSGDHCWCADLNGFQSTVYFSHHLQLVSFHRHLWCKGALQHNNTAWLKCGHLLSPNLLHQHIEKGLHLLARPWNVTSSAKPTFDLLSCPVQDYCSQDWLKLVSANIDKAAWTGTKPNIDTWNHKLIN